MRRSLSLNWLALAALWACTACGSSDHPAGAEVPDTWEGVCIDSDRDGFGVECDDGPDCDDTNAAVHADCGCSVPGDGCACEPGSQPVDCVISRKNQPSGSLLCNTGVRYCRDSAWTECIGARSFEVPAPGSASSRIGRGLLDADASVSRANNALSPLGRGLVDPTAPCEDPCQPTCYKAVDNLETITSEPGLAGAGGGITLVATSGSTMTDPDAIDPNPPCMVGTIIPAFGQLDNDCDGIPDNYDRTPGAPPFATDHTTITMDLAPGEQGSKTFELQFQLNTVDVYFLLDTTASMDGELNRLISDLTTGTFLDNPATPAVDEATAVVCASPYGSTTTDPTLKTKGIAGNIACLVPNSGFGAGYFREIPFDNPDANNLKHAFDWFIPYEHRQDISTNVGDTLTALKKFYTTGNQSWAEAPIFALSAVATGAQIYTGWDRPGIEARTCPDNTRYGWPCFRREAIPIVILITDASMMNGPDVDVYKNGDPSCFTSSAVYTTTTTACTSDASCEAVAAYAGKGYFCTENRCSVKKTLAANCVADGIPDGKVGTSYNQALNYTAGQTNTMAVGRDAMGQVDARYIPVEKVVDVNGVQKDRNETFATAEQVGVIDNKFVTYAGDTRGMSADVYASNLGTVCSQWPATGNAAATSAATPGYPDAVFEFEVTGGNKQVTISTAGSHHAPTLAIISKSAAVAGTPGVSTQVNAPAVAGGPADTSSWDFVAAATGTAGAKLPAAFDYSVGVDLTGGGGANPAFAGSWPRASFGECMTGSAGATDLGPDAVFEFTPSSNLTGVSFTTGATQIIPTADATANNATLSSAIIDLKTVVGQTAEYYGTTSTSTPNRWTTTKPTATHCRHATNNSANREHVFKFTLASPAQVEVRLSGADGGTPATTFDSVLSVFGPLGAAPTANVAITNPMGCDRNATGDEVLTGTYAAGTYYVLVQGYDSVVGTASPYGAYTLSVRELTDEAIALYDSAPSSPTVANITGPTPPGTANTNDVFYDFNVGQIDGQYIRLNAGDTSAAGIHPDYVEGSFQQAAGSCSNVTGLSNDSVVEFSVNTNRRVRVETFDGTGLDPNQQAGFDHVVALVERPIRLTVTPVPVTGNDSATDVSSAPSLADPNHGANGVILAGNVPTSQGDYSQFTGVTYAPLGTMSPSVEPQEMYDVANPATTTCGLVDSTLQDVVYRFDVDAASAGLYNFDTIGSDSTTFLSLHRGTPDTFTALTPTLTSSTVATNNGTGSSSPSGAQTGVSLGTVDGKTLTYAGSTDANTANKWTDAQYQACRLAGGDAAHEHVLSFTVAATRQVSITLSAVGLYDPSIALFTTAPVAGSTQSGLAACSRVSGATTSNPGGLASVGSGVLRGNLVAGTYYLVVHGYQNSNSYGSYNLAVADVNSRVARTVATDDSGAGGSQVASGLDLGDVSASVVTYSGTTNTSVTTNKWSMAQAGSNNGCRSASAVPTPDGVREHVLKFSVTGQTRTLRLNLTRTGASWEPVMTVLNAAPTVNAPFGASFQACARAYGTSPVANGGGLTATGNASTGGTITGSFPVGTYYVVVNGYTHAAVGAYTLVITDTASSAGTAAWPNNSKDTELNAATTSSGAPFADFGILTSAGASYSGTVSTSTPNKWTSGQVATGANASGCRQDSTEPSPEHLFKFTLTGSTTVNLSLTTTGSYDTVLTLFGPSGSAPASGSTVSNPVACTRNTGGAETLSGTYGAGTYYVLVHSYDYNLNHTGNYTLAMSVAATSSGAAWAANSQDPTLDSSLAAAFVDFGSLTASGASYTGTTSASTPNKWTGAQLGSASCRAATTSASAEHVFKFTLASARNLSLRLSASGSYDPALSVFGPTGSAPTEGATVPTPSDCNRTISGDDLLSGNYGAGTYYVMVHGYNPSANGTGTYTLSIAETVAATTQWANTSQDATLNAATTGAAPFVNLGTIDATTTSASYSGTTSSSTPRKWTGAELGAASCRAATSNTAPEHVFTFTLTGSTSLRLGLNASYDSALSLFGPLGSTPSMHSTVSSPVACSRVNGADDAIAGTYGAGTYYVVVHAYDPTVSATGTYTLSIARAPTSSAAWAANAQDTTLNGAIGGGYVDFGTLTAAGASYTGTTSSAATRWSRTNMGGGSSCRRGSNSGAVGEHVFRFTLASSTTMTLATSGIGSGYDNSISLFGPSTGLPVAGSTIPNRISCADNNGGGTGESLTGTYDAGTYYVVVHGYENGEVGAYTLTLTPSATAKWSTDNQNTTLNGNSSPYSDFGTLGTTALSYTGETTQGSTPSKWTSGELGTASCRNDSSQNRHEHMFRFYLAGTTTVTAALSLPSGSDFSRPVLSLFGPSASAPVKDSSVADPIGCSYTASGTETLSGTYGAGYYYVMVHGYGDDDNGKYTLTLTPGTATTFTANGKDSTLNVSALSAPPIADFGTLAAAGRSYSGTTSSSTPSKWTAANLGTASCRQAGADAGSEHAFKFTLSGSTTLDLTLAANFDSDLSLFGPSSTGPTAFAPVSDPNGCSRNSGADDTISGTYAAGTYYVVVHGYTNSDKGNYTLTLTPYPSAVATFAANSQNTALNYSPDAPVADFGNLGSAPVAYTGVTSGATATKWTAAQLGSAACRDTGVGTADAVSEHLFKFTLTGAQTVGLTLAADFNSSLSLFGAGGSTSPPVATSSIANPNACSGGNGSSTNDSLTASLTAGTYYVLVHGYTDSASGTYTLTLTPNAVPTASFAANSQDTALNSRSLAPYADFGDLGTAAVYYAGTTSATTPTKWTPTELGSPSCRTADATAVNEHLFKFTLLASTQLSMVVSSNFDSVLTLYGPSGAQPYVHTTIANPRVACNDDTNGIDAALSGTYAAGTYYLILHAYQNDKRGNYTLTLTPTATPATTWAANSQDGALNSGSAPYADFGLLGATPLSYTGSTSLGTNKWSPAQVVTAAGNTNPTTRGCRGGTDKYPPEHMFRFTLDATATVSLGLTTDFNPVLSLFGPSASSPSRNSTVPNGATCYHDTANTGLSVTNGNATISGTYAAGTYYVMVHGYYNSTNEKGAYTLTVSKTTARTVATNNTGAETTVSSSGSVDLGVVDNYDTTYAGTTSTGAPNKWTDANIRSAGTSGTGAATGCRASTTQDSGREQIIKFTVGTTRSLQVALTGALDGVLSIYESGTLPVVGADVTTLQACSHSKAPASNATLTTGSYTAVGGVISGTFAAGTYYALVHGYDTDNVGSYTLTVTDTSVSYTTTPVTGDPDLANGSGPQSGVYLGVADGRLINYAGDTMGAVNKWSQANLSSAGNTGCRLAGSDTGREHVLRFAVTTPRRLALRVARPAASTYQPVLSVFNGGAPVVGSDVPGLMACSHLTSTAAEDNVTPVAGMTAADGLITGTFAAGTYYAVVHAYTAASAEGAYTLQVLDATPEALGEADIGRRITISGDTSTGGVAFNQWTGSDLPDVGMISNGGRLDAAQRTNELLYSFTVAGATKNLTVSLTASFDSVLSVFDTLPVGGGAVTGLLETAHANLTYSRSITRDFDPGTYYVLVHGYRSTPAAAASGAFTLAVGDGTWTSNLLACDSRGTGSKLAAMNLTAGTYYLVVKSGAGTGLLAANYRYVLNVRRTFNQPFIACDYEGFGEGSRRGFVEADLIGGKTYAVVVRGVTPAAKGTYGLILRDMTAGTAPIGCANSAGYTNAGANAQGFTADLTANQKYYVAVRSNSSSSVGQANVRIANYTTSTCAFNNVTFDAVGNSAGTSTYVPAKIVTQLPAGEYYAVVKGNQNLTQSSVKIPTGSVAGIPDDRGRGRYQITFGDASLATNNQQFSPPAWGTSTSGVYSDLLARGIRVITVNSLPSAGGSADLFMVEQSKVISDKTGAKDVNGAPIRRNIGDNGTGMGFAIVDAVAKFTNAVQMDISVRLSLTPDDPGVLGNPTNRRFTFLSRAVPAPAGTNNGCGAPIDTDANGVLDTHTACGPGATPRFEVMVTNPAAAPVPLNPQDLAIVPSTGLPGAGGYLMTLQLVGKDRLIANATPQVVDEVPIYVIPQAVLPDPEVVYQPSATYTQTVGSTGCTGREVPTWKALKYSDSLPPGTAIEWRVCGGDDAAELAACDLPGGFVVAARVTSGDVCTDSSTCTNGFCNLGRCEYPVGPSCVNSSECGLKGVCVASACRWTADPAVEGISLQPAIAERFVGKDQMRVQVLLEANAARSAAPSIQEFRLDYECAQQE